MLRIIGGEDELLPFFAFERTLGARLLPLAFHRALEGLAIDGHLPFAREVFDEVERHSKRVIQLERLVAGELPACRFRGPFDAHLPISEGHQPAPR